MIEKTVLDYLLASGKVPVMMEIPEGGAQPPFIIIEKTGGGETDHIKRATLAIQSYGTSLFTAARLNESMKKAMERITELPEICACRLNSDYNFTDPTTKRYRYQAVFDITYY